MSIPKVPCYPNDTPELLRARITNYEEAMADALKTMQGNPDVANMFQAILAAGGEEHLRALRQFEEIMAAVIAFKDRVLTEAAKDQCPTCGGMGTHSPDCLLAAALRIQPHMLEKAETPALAQLMLLRQRIAALALEADTAERSEELQGLLRDFPLPEPALSC